MTTNGSVPIVRAENEGERRWWYGGGLHTWKAHASETGGRFCVFEDVLVRGKTTPVHRHPEADETLYVLEGEILIDFDGQRRTVGAGGLVVAPRGVSHAFVVTSETARLLVMVTPGSAEQFYRDASEPASADHAGGAGPVDFTRIRASAQKTGATEILGPPPFDAK